MSLKSLKSIPDWIFEAKPHGLLQYCFFPGLYHHNFRKLSQFFFNLAVCIQAPENNQDTLKARENEIEFQVVCVFIRSNTWIA